MHNTYLFINILFVLLYYESGVMVIDHYDNNTIVLLS